MFYLRTKTWTKCNDLPYPLAFATVISTPKGAWILGGKTSPVERASVKMNLNIFSIKSRIDCKVTRDLKGCLAYYLILTSKKL